MKFVELVWHEHKFCIIWYGMSLAIDGSIQNKKILGYY